jgi:prepilin-type processing-associated H-X9-DG protein
MKHKINFSKKDVAVVLGCVVFLLAGLGAVGDSGRRRAKEAVCLSNLQQWGLIWSKYTTDNDGCFPDVTGGEVPTVTGRWFSVLESLYKDYKIRLCPMATKTSSEGGRNPFMAWYTTDFVSGKTVEWKGSYGLNEWLENNQTSGTYKSNYFRNVNAKPANNIPVFIDCAWYDLWVFHDNMPPSYDGDLTNCAGRGPPGEMKRVCINRHNGGVNVLFLDWSARKVGLKELWKLKWHRSFNTDGPMTLAGGVWPTDWPVWMRNFKDY